MRDAGARSRSGAVRPSVRLVSVGARNHQQSAIERDLDRLNAYQLGVSELYHRYDHEDAYEKQWGVSNPVAGDYWRNREAVVFQSVAQHFKCPMSSLRVLEIGVGHGHELAKFAQLGIPQSNLFGIDLVYERLVWAKSIYPAIAFAQQDATRLLFPNDTFDIVCQFTCFMHLQGIEMLRTACREMARVLKPGGLIVWWDIAPVRWPVALTRRLHEACNATWRKRPVQLLRWLKRAVGEALAASSRREACRNFWEDDFLAIRHRDIERMFPGLKVRARPIGTDYDFWSRHWFHRRGLANLFWRRAWLSTHCFATIVKE